jgi:hypothetical protein
MHASKAGRRLILEGLCASWAVQDMAAVRACVHRQAVYRHHMPPGAWPIPGIVRGKQDIVRSLSHFLHDFDVIRYCPLKIAPDGDDWDLRVAFEYAHKLTGHSFDGTARIKAQIDGDKLRSFEVIHDAPRLGAFFELVNRMSIET